MNAKLGGCLCISRRSSPRGHIILSHFLSYYELSLCFYGVGTVTYPSRRSRISSALNRFTKINQSIPASPGIYKYIRPPVQAKVLSQGPVLAAGVLQPIRNHVLEILLEALALRVISRGCVLGRVAVEKTLSMTGVIEYQILSERRRKSKRRDLHFKHLPFIL